MLTMPRGILPLIGLVFSLGAGAYDQGQKDQKDISQCIDQTCPPPTFRHDKSLPICTKVCLPGLKTEEVEYQLKKFVTITTKIKERNGSQWYVGSERNEENLPIKRIPMDEPSRDQWNQICDKGDQYQDKSIIDEANLKTDVISDSMILVDFHQEVTLNEEENTKTITIVKKYIVTTTWSSVDDYPIEPEEGCTEQFDCSQDQKGGGLEIDYDQYISNCQQFEQSKS